MSKIKYPSVVLGSKAYCEGFTNAIKHIRELNKDTQEDHNTDHLLGTIGSLTRRVQELEAALEQAQQSFLKQAFVNGALSKKPMSDSAIHAIIADVMRPIVKKAADQCLQDVVNARHVRQTPTAADQRLQDDIDSFYALVDRFDKKWGMK